MLSICMDVSKGGSKQCGLHWDCTGVRNACEDLTASESDASSMVPRWTSLPRLLEPRPLLILVDFVGEREQFSLNSMSLRFSDGLAEVYLLVRTSTTLLGKMVARKRFAHSSGEFSGD